MKLPPALERLEVALGVVRRSDRPHLEFDLPLMTKNEGNAHGHWRSRHKRSAPARAAAMLATQASLRRLGYQAGLWQVVAVLTRVAPRALDEGDNLGSALKAVRDGVSDALGVDDKAGLLFVLTSQAKGAPKEQGVRVELFLHRGDWCGCGATERHVHGEQCAEYAGRRPRTTELKPLGTK